LNHFDIVSAQPTAWSILARAHRSERIASTYLFHGPNGVGIWSLAVHFAALVNCESPFEDSQDDTQRPCGKCGPCRLTFDLNYEGLELIVPITSHKNLSEAMELARVCIDEKRADPLATLSSSSPTSIPIAMAREVARKLSLRAQPGITRVVLFYRMDKMKQVAADALLKLIEEPPPETIIILTAPRPDMLLPTIQSRSQMVRLTRLPEDKMIKHLRENHRIPEEKASIAARISEGILSKAIQVAQSLSSDDSAFRHTALDLFAAIFQRSPAEQMVRMRDNLNFRDRGQIESLLDMWQTLIRDCHYIATADSTEGLTNLDLAERIRPLASAFADSRSAETMVAAIKNTLADMRRNVHIQTALAALTLQLGKAGSRVS
jgi:DNA polymerase-3 subunit delta'